MLGVIGAQVYFNKAVRERPVAILTSRLYPIDNEDTISIGVALVDLYIRDLIKRYEAPDTDKLELTPALVAIRTSPVILIEENPLTVTPGMVLIKPSPYLEDVDPDANIKILPALVSVGMSPVLQQPEEDFLTIQPSATTVILSTQYPAQEELALTIMPSLNSITLI